MKKSTQKHNYGIDVLGVIRRIAGLILNNASFSFFEER